MAHVAVIGGGIGGLATALFLARRGHEATVLERETRRAGLDLDKDFFDWERPRTPQAVQPHAMLAPVRTVLMAEAPDVYAAMLRLGAVERHEFDWFGTHPPYRPGDEDLVTIRGRRIVLETALSDAVGQEPNVRWLTEPVEGLAIAGQRVTGVVTASDVVEADLVVDAAGRRSPVPGWLVEAGCRPPVVENHPVGIAYFSRWYRLRADGPADPGRVWDVSVAPFAIGLAFPSDNRVVGLTLALPVADPTRGALRDPIVFEAAARLFPSCREWLSLAPEPVGDMHIMAGIDNRWTSLVDGDGPVATSLVGVGDTMAHTNPTLGQGTALALLAAQHVASTLEDTVDHAAWAQRTLRPWFDHQVVVDRGDEALFAGGPLPVLDELARARFAAAPCALEDPVVMRARAQVRHLAVAPADAFATAEVRAHLATWLERHPGFGAGMPGPTRADWEAITREAVTV